MRGKRRAARIDGFLDEHMVQQVEAGPTQWRGQGHAIKAQLARALPHSLQQLAAGAMLMVHLVLGGQGVQLVPDEPGHPLDEFAGRRGSFEVGCWGVACRVLSYK